MISTSAGRLGRQRPSTHEMEEPAVEKEPVNDGPRSLVVLYRVSDSVDVPKRLIRTSCSPPSVAASHVRSLLAADGIDPKRLLSMRCYDPGFDGWEEAAPDANLALSRCRVIEGVFVLELLLRLTATPPPELAAAMLSHHHLHAALSAPPGAHDGGGGGGGGGGGDGGGGGGGGGGGSGYLQSHLPAELQLRHGGSFDPRFDPRPDQPPSVHAVSHCTHSGMRSHSASQEALDTAAAQQQQQQQQ